MHILICKFCSKEFSSKKVKQIYCSRTCQSKGGWKFNKSKPKKRQGVYLYCQFCKKRFYVPIYRQYKAKFCSRNCLAKVHLKKYIKDYGFKKTNKPFHKYKYLTIKGKRIREHRYIMQRHLNRKLESWEHVHHINGDSQDNRIENLIVLSNSDHQKEENKLKRNK